jgi:hypothetical protein
MWVNITSRVRGHAWSRPGPPRRARRP